MTIKSLKLFFVLAFVMPLVNGKLEELYSWKVLEFDTPEGYPENPEYQKKATFVDGIHFLNKIIIMTTPRFSPGIPASLSWIPRDGGKSPKLQAYPDWSWHERSVTGKKNCEGITSANRLNMDRCGNLWVVDSGKEGDTEPSAPDACPPSIVVFNSRNHRFVKRIVLPPHVIRNNTLITNIVVWSEPSDYECKRAKAYIADVYQPALIVYDSETEQFKSYNHPSMHPNPACENFNYFGHNVKITDGIFGLALDEQKRELYYKVFAGTATVKVKLDDLENAPNGQFPAILLANSSSQVAGLSFGLKNGVLVYSNVANTDLVSYTIESGERRLAYAPDSLQYIADIKPYGPNGMVMVNARFQNYFSDTVDSSQINLKILKYTQ